MEEQLISFETAKLAKEKGFDIHCRFHYDEEMFNIYENEDFPYNSWNGSLFVPTQSLLQKWLREEHDIHIQICICLFSIKKYQYIIHSEDVHRKSSQYLDGAIIGDYEYVLEKGLSEGLKLIK